MASRTDSATTSAVPLVCHALVPSKSWWCKGRRRLGAMVLLRVGCRVVNLSATNSKAAWKHPHWYLTWKVWRKVEATSFSDVTWLLCTCFKHSFWLLFLSLRILMNSAMPLWMISYWFGSSSFLDDQFFWESLLGIGFSILRVGFSNGDVLALPRWCLGLVLVLLCRCLGDVAVICGDVLVMSRWCLGGGTVMSQWCLRDALVMSRSCLRFVLVVSQPCFGDVSVMSRRCFGGVSVMSRWCLAMSRSCLGFVKVVSQWCASDVLVMLWWCLGDVSVLCWWCFNDVSVMFRSCFGDGSVLFEWCVDEIWVMSRSCADGVSVMCRWSFGDALVMSRWCLSYVLVVFHECFGESRWCVGEGVVMFWW